VPQAAPAPHRLYPRRAGQHRLPRRPHMWRSADAASRKSEESD